MKKLFTLSIILVALTSLLSDAKAAQYSNDTIFLNSGKYYICNVISVNSQYVQYGSLTLASNVSRIARDEYLEPGLPDVIYLKSGNKLVCKLISESNGRIYYARNISTSFVSSLHLNNGLVIPKSQFASFDMNETPQKAAAPTRPVTPPSDYSMEAQQQYEQASEKPQVVSRTVTPVKQNTQVSQEPYRPQQQAAQQQAEAEQPNAQQAETEAPVVQQAVVQQAATQQVQQTPSYEPQRPQAQDNDYKPQEQTEQAEQAVPDQIILRDGNTIIVLIQQISENQVVCQDAYYPEYIYEIPFNEINQIYYSNGQFEDFSSY